ncbi:MAG: hypothetical protein NVS3B21_16710 [Acidimicrobiales bacterium]
MEATRKPEMETTITAPTINKAMRVLVALPLTATRAAADATGTTTPAAAHVRLRSREPDHRFAPFIDDLETRRRG